MFYKLKKNNSRFIIYFINQYCVCNNLKVIEYYVLCILTKPNGFTYLNYNICFAYYE